ncbi:hypothetical protein [Comamonas badia]|uniref:hypothetical protein n=1 Tax=Comamonas badia TaxID=265291 RepID=UPI00042A3F2C|nr:hypothetical protein [Comamonas badia]
MSEKTEACIARRYLVSIGKPFETIACMVQAALVFEICPPALAGSPACGRMRGMRAL